MKNIARALATALFVLPASPALAQPVAPKYGLPIEEEVGPYPPDSREAIRRAYDQGYDKGYRKGVEDGKRMVSAPVAPPPQAVPVPVPTGPIRVTSAFYGDGSRQCDATRFVSRQANGRASISFEVTNGICGDPAPGNRKSLDITFYCGAVAKTASAYEHRSIYLDCP